MNSNLKKFLPLIILVLGIIVLGGVFLMIKGKKTQTTETDESGETALMDVPLNKRPIVALTPTEDGHYLKLHIEKIQITGAQTLDYELIYQVPERPSQGVPGSVDIKDKTSFDADLLLGSESSGKFRYDEGVESGTITLRFRNDKGKLLTKFSSDFHMQESPETVTSSDGNFSVKLDSTPKSTFFITMPSVGTPKDINGEPKFGPYVVHSSGGDQFAGMTTVKGGSLYHFEGGDWKKLDDGRARDLGFFYTM